MPLFAREISQKKSPSVLSCSESRLAAEETSQIWLLPSTRAKFQGLDINIPDRVYGNETIAPLIELRDTGLRATGCVKRGIILEIADLKRKEGNVNCLGK